MNSPPPSPADLANLVTLQTLIDGLLAERVQGIDLLKSSTFPETADPVLASVRKGLVEAICEVTTAGDALSGKKRQMLCSALMVMTRELLRTAQSRDAEAYTPAASAADTSFAEVGVLKTARLVWHTAPTILKLLYRAHGDAHNPDAWKSALVGAVKKHHLKHHAVFTTPTGGSTELLPAMKNVTDAFGEFSLYPLGQFNRLTLESVVADSPSWRIAHESVLEVEARYCTDYSSADKAGLPMAERFALLQFVDHYSGEPDMPWLDSETVRAGFDKIREEYHGPDVIDQLQSFFYSLCYSPRYTDLTLKKGLLLWGPPGTGKTHLAVSLCNKVGFNKVCENIAGSEILGGIVGESEKKFKAVMERARNAPWLPFGIVIDEIDAIAPNRLDDKASLADHKVDLLSTILTLFGGARSVDNLFIIGCTNRMSKMDAAFLRRMHGKYFVGLPSAAARALFFANKQLIQFEPGALEHLKELTTNFSGDNLKKLVSLLTLTALRAASPPVPNKFTTKEVRTAVLEICKIEDIRVGDSYLPMHYGSGGVPTSSPVEEGFFLAGLNCTGRIFVDVAKKSIFVERRKGPHEPSYVSEHAVNVRVLTVDVIMNVLIRFAIERNMNFVQLVSGNVLAKNNSTDESNSIQFINGLVEESLAYSRSMMIFDLDGMVNVEVNESNPQYDQRQSGGFHSISYSVLRPQLMHSVFNMAKSRAFVDEQGTQFFWTVIVGRHPHLAARFHQILEFPFSNEESKRHRDMQEAQVPHTCRHCKQRFVMAQKDTCTAHKGRSVNRTTGLFVNPGTGATWQQKDEVVWDCCKTPYFFGGGECPKKTPHEKAA